MATTEPTINDTLALVLSDTRSLWRGKGVVRSENTGVLKGAGKKPDILVVEPNVSPVVIETEVLPASSVEADAVVRLGEQLAANGRPLLSAVAVRMPSRLRDVGGLALRQEIDAANDFEMCLYTGKSPEAYKRWPTKGWIRGTALDLSVLTQAAAVPPEVVYSAASTLIEGVSDAAGLLNDIAAKNPQAVHAISERLLQSDGEQTRKMAMAILANAFLFHENVARGPGRLAGVRN